VIVVPLPASLSTSNDPPPTCARSFIIAIPK